MAKATIGSLMEQASVLLVETQYAACERLCLQALDQARHENDHDAIARIIMPLQEARRQRRQIACDHGVHVLTGPVLSTEAILKKFSCGCLMLINPPYDHGQAQALIQGARQNDLYLEVLLLDDQAQQGAFEWLMEQSGDRMIAHLAHQPPQEQLGQLLDQVQHLGDHERAHQRIAALARQLVQSP